MALNTKKTKLSGIVDNSSMGFTVGSAEMPIRNDTALGLRKAMRKDNRFIIQGDIMNEGIATLWITDDNPVTYQFKRQGSNLFLNVTGNPTVLMTGKNSIPVLLKDKKYASNSVVNTFKYANRIMFAILEFIPGFDFRWEGKERKLLESGEFNISRLQYAWYSADLANRRDAVLLFLRKCYNGQNATKSKANNLAADLGLNISAYSDNGNLNFTSLSGNNKIFGITLYAKDQGPKGDPDNKDRLMSLIRFDGTFFDYFLKEHKIKTVVDLERKYEEICDQDGYDIGFVKWLASHVFERLKLEYVTSMTLNDYRTKINKIEQAINSKTSAENVLLNYWFNYNKHKKTDDDEDGVEYKSVAEKCNGLGVDYKKHTRYISKIKDTYGIDINISRSFHDAMLLNRILGRMTEKERGDFMKNPKSNIAITFEEMAKRDTENVNDLSGLLVAKGITNIRKLKPVVLKSNDFWAYKKLRGEL